MAKEVRPEALASKCKMTHAGKTLVCACVEGEDGT